MDLIMSTPEEWAWAAGLFEGEGWIGMNGGTVAIAIHMTDRDVLERFQTVLEGGHIQGPYDKGPRRRPMYQYTTGHRDIVRRACQMLLPWLGERRSARVIELSPQIREPRPTSPDCGWDASTSWGVTRHSRRGEPPCQSCRDRQNATSRAYRARVAARQAAIDRAELTPAEQAAVDELTRQETGDGTA
jgi:hypothetical protein